MSLTLRNGKFYDSDGQVVPLEHGNKEQFDILEKHRKRRQEFEGDGHELTPSIETVASVVFQCVCGDNFLGMDNEDDCELDAIEGLVGKKDKCNRCGQQYILSQDAYGDIVAKFAN